jgi:gamma-D-glutamyl-L-lysine dipeptidyl-peptidase
MTSYHLITATFILLVIGLGCAEKTAGEDNAVREWIDQIRLKYAPDKRVAIFNVSYENGIIRGETNLPEARELLAREIRSRSLTDSVVLLTPSYGFVNVSVCNIRSEPRHSAELSTQSLMGTPLKIYKEQNGWYFVQTPDGYLGWLDDGGLVQANPERYAAWQRSEKVVVSTPFAFIYADLEKNIVSDVVEGNILEAGELMDRYRQVRLPDGRTGIIDAASIVPYQEFITLKEPLLENILHTSHQFMGRPYLWGGTSGKGMDCSGFTKTVFYLNGLELPRDASQQVNVGLEVPSDTTLQNLIAGDLIFFGTKGNNDQRERITHVAIYLGKGKIIHASDRVQIESLKRGDPDFAEARLKSMVRAKRMLENLGENGVRKLEDHPIYKY